MSNPSSREELLFEICESKEELQQHIKTFLKIDLPDCIVDENSTSTPMDFVWEIYNLMRTGKGPQRHVVAASRNSSKTLSACIIRFYSMIHFRRTGTHLAATMDQSQSAIGYLDKFLAIPEVHKYISIDNTRTKELKGLPPNSHTKNDSCKLRVSVATKKGVNSQRGSLNMRDETDLLPPAIISESVFIADPTQDEHRFGPIEIDLSSRKTNDGPMQQKIDEAEGKDPPPDLKLHKWSAVDWMRKCPTEIHKPELPKIKAWLNTDNLKVTWDEEIFKRLPKTEQTLNQEIDAYVGCKTCPAFVVCQARSPKQKSKSKMLRDINFVSLILRSVNSAEAIIAQALNLKPESSSIVFKTFRRHRHFLKPHEFYKFITGVYWNPERMTEEEIEEGLDRDDPLTLIKITPDKHTIYKALVDLGWDINYGVDWGYNPASAVCIVGAYHRRQKRGVVFHVASSHEYANADWAAYIAKNIWSQWPGDLVCPDMADPASPSYFGKYKMPCLDYKPTKIETGVSQIRSLLWNPGAQTEMFSLLDDGDQGENWKLAEAFEKWTYKKTPIGFDYDKFEDNDYCDFCLAPGTLVITSQGTKKIEDIIEGDMVLTHKGRFRRVYATMNRQYEGSMVALKAAGRQEILMTPEHRLLTKTLKRSNRIIDGVQKTGQLVIIEGSQEWREASSITKSLKNSLAPKDALIFNASSIDEQDHVFDLSEFHKEAAFNDDWVEIMRPQRKKLKINRFVKNNKYISFLVGYFLAEGSCSQNLNHGSKKRAVGFACHAKEISVARLLDKASSFFEGNITNVFHSGGNSAVITINSVSLWSICKPLGKSAEKSPPEWLMIMNEENTWWAFLGYLFGDGCFTGERITVNSISPSIAYGMLTLSTKLGLTPRIKFTSRANQEKAHPQYIIEFSATESQKIKNKISAIEELRDLYVNKTVLDVSRDIQDSSKVFVSGDKESAHLVLKTSAMKYSGLVYNIAVEEDESYTANGVAVHNCDPTRYCFAPFIEESNISILANQDRKQDLKTGVLIGDKEAIAEYQRKQELQAQFAEHMRSNFGITDPFGTKITNEKDKDKPKKSGSIKFRM